MRRALISVWDKSGLEGFAAGLADLGWELVASGATSASLESSGIPHRKVEEVTGWPEMLGGRVKTLHPAIHAGILADRSKAGHLSDLERHSLAPLDLVVCNLYPFSSQPGIEMIDVGGPTMVRAAAKNHAHVGVVVSPQDYGRVLEELRSDGWLAEGTRRDLARKAFAHTAAYDAAIVAWMDSDGEGGILPPTLHLALERTGELRYAENPHQRGARYTISGERGWWDGVRVHGGLPLSYLNHFDAEAAYQLAFELAERSGKVAAVVVKHANPAGVALGEDPAAALSEAVAADPVSAFGGIAALSTEMDLSAAEALAAGPQMDVVVAPSYGKGAVEVLARRRRNTRILEGPPPRRPSRELRSIDGGFLVQEADRISPRSAWKVVGAIQPAEDAWADMDLAWVVCARTGSNAIVLASGGRVVGVGAGQQNRVDSARIAIEKAGDAARGAVAASDAFFPFPDGLEALAAAGVSVVVQPGGSVRDSAVTEAADAAGVAMVHTGERHFRH